MSAIDDDAARRFAALIAIPTISRSEPEETDWTAFAKFRQVLAQQYPLLHSRLEHELVAEHTLVFRWAGSAPTRPVVLMAHQDVVDPGTVQWQHPPFGAHLEADIPEPTLWGRGAIDDKGSLVAIAEAVERLLASGYQPKTDVYLVFGHDEETHGSGAAAAAAALAQRGVQPDFVLDEGGAVVSGFLPAVTAPLAAIGVAEKGVLFVRLTVTDAGGHGSTPPPISAIGRLARAIAAMDAKPFPSRFTPTLRGMFEAAGRGGRGPLGFIYRAARYTGPILRRALVAVGPEGDAMTRTTRVATVIEGGHARNATPEHASAIVNLRILPGFSIQDSVARLRKVIADPLVQLEILEGTEPSPVSPASGAGWDEIEAVLGEIIPEAIPTPYTQTGATDSRWFSPLTNRIYRFTPFDLTAAERATLHAVDERIRVGTWLRGIRFYEALLAKL